MALLGKLPLRQMVSMESQKEGFLLITYLCPIDFKRRRLAVTLRNQLNYPLQFHPFVFNKIALLWVAIGIIGGIIAGTYWIVLEGLLHLNDLMIDDIAICTGLVLAAVNVIHFLAFKNKIPVSEIP